MTTKLEWKLYRDEKGLPRKTRSGQYRFDLVVKDSDGVPVASMVGLRLDYDRRRILPTTVQLGGRTYTVAEVSPEYHRFFVDQICEEIADALGLKHETPL